MASIASQNVGEKLDESLLPGARIDQTGFSKVECCCFNCWPDYVTSNLDYILNGDCDSDDTFTAFPSAELGFYKQCHECRGENVLVDRDCYPKDPTKIPDIIEIMRGHATKFRTNGNHYLAYIADTFIKRVKSKRDEPTQLPWNWEDPLVCNNHCSMCVNSSCQEYANSIVDIVYIERKPICQVCKQPSILTDWHGLPTLTADPRGVAKQLIDAAEYMYNAAVKYGGHPVFIRHYEKDIDELKQIE